MPDLLLNLHATDLADVALVALIFWILIAWARRVHAGLALAGLGMVGGVYLLARQFELQLTAWLFQGFFAVVVVLLVVVFQDDLRRLFEQIAVLSLRRRRPPVGSSSLAAIVRSLRRLAAERTGALLVFPGREPLERHLRGGVFLDAALSEELLLSIFDASSPGHDGAAVVRGSRLERCGAHLPLSDNHEQLGPGGTRHAAALGLAERCDALCVVVSEERGTVSIAAAGTLRTLDSPAQVRQEIEHFLARAGQPLEPKPRSSRLRRGVLEAGTALVLATVAWLAFVPGATVIEKTLQIPVEVDKLPVGYTLQIEPPQIEVTVSGTRRDLLLVGQGDLVLTIDATLAELGRRTFAVERHDLQHPPEVRVIDLRPDKVRLSFGPPSPQN